MRPTEMQQGIDEPGVAQEEHPRVGSDEETGPERKDDQEEIEVLARAGTRDEEGEGKAEDEADERRDGGNDERFEEDSGVERVGEAQPVFESPRRAHAAVGAASEEGVDEENGEGDEEEEDGESYGR